MIKFEPTIVISSFICFVFQGQTSFDVADSDLQVYLVELKRKQATVSLLMYIVYSNRYSSLHVTQSDSLSALVLSDSLFTNMKHYP